MPKVFYTEKDIEDLVARGILSLEVNDNTVLTDLAYEKANRLGVKLVSERATIPPAAPVRPYVAQGAAQAAAPRQGEAAQASDLHERIRSAVTARLGNQVDPALLDAIIKRVLASTGVK
jgi:hypothetical protein